MIHFRVNAIPIAQPRQRHRVITDKAGRTFASNYTPARDPVNDYKASVRMAAAWEYGDLPPLEGPLYFKVRFILPRPKAMIWKRKPMPRQLHDRKPDVDNLLKSLLDSLAGLLFRADSQIARVSATKWTANGYGEKPHVEVWVEQQSAAGRPLHEIERGLEAEDCNRQAKGA